MFDKQEMSMEDLRMLQQVTLSQNPALFYGAGIKVKSAHTPRQVARFENQLKQAVEDVTMEYRGYQEFDQGQVLDIGRYSRLSRTVTPGSPILELEEDTPPPSPLPPLQEDRPLSLEAPSAPAAEETFLTEQKQSTTN